MSEQEIEAVYKLSPQQQGMLFGAIADKDTARHVEQVWFVLEGPLNWRAFRRSWQSIVTRHDVFRTAFAWRDVQTPMQAVFRTASLTIERRDWSDCATPMQDQLTPFLVEDRRRGIDLGSAPLMRITLVKISAIEHLLIWTLHHIIVDGWCLPLLLREFIASYGLARDGVVARRSSSAPRYRDYISWLGGQNTAAATRFWSEQLSGLKNPTAIGRPAKLPDAGPNGPYHHSELICPEPQVTAMRQFARQNRLTLNTIIQATWALLLARYSGDSDVTFGTTVSGRPTDLPDSDSMIGLFATTLPFRVQIPKHGSAVDWLQSLQRQHTEIRRWEFVSPGQLQQLTEIPGLRPLFESAVVFENYPLRGSQPSEAAAAIRISRVDYAGATTPYALTLLAAPAREIVFRLVCDTRRFHRDDVSTVLTHLNAMLLRLLSSREASPAKLVEFISVTETPRMFDAHSIQCVKHPDVDMPNDVRAAIETVFGTTEIDYASNFFAIGGHSLLAVQLIEAIRENCGVNLPLSAIFEASTLIELASSVTRAQRVARVTDSVSTVKDVEGMSDSDALTLLNLLRANSSYGRW